MSAIQHATAVVLGDKGVMITGPSGAGKSLLARQLMEYARLNGRFAALVGDDRIHLERVGDQILASPHAKIAGMIEIRGFGIATTNFMPMAAMDLLVSCGTVIKTRLPDEGERWESLLGVRLLRIETRPDDPGSVFTALGFGHLTVRL